MSDEGGDSTKEAECPACGAVYLGAPSSCSVCGELLIAASRRRSDPLLDQVIDGKYHILERISGGGMGAVYKAEHAMMNRIVAFKVLHRHLAEGSEDQQFLRRFQREARLASRIDHPHAVTIYDFGVHGEQAYLVMQYVEGEILSEILEVEGALELTRAGHLLSQIASALEEAHTHGVIHRDLKPENIIVSQRKAGEEFAIVLDFGIAKALTCEDSKISTVTKTGRIIGTPQYMSPEQVQGQKNDVRTDVYALGIIAYELLSGEPPFTKGNLMQLMMRHVNDTPVPLRHKVPQRNISAAVDSVVLRALKKNPDDRQQSAAQFAENFADAMRGAPVPFEDSPVDVELGKQTLEADTPENVTPKPFSSEKAKRILLPTSEPEIGDTGYRRMFLGLLVFVVFTGALYFFAVGGEEPLSLGSERGYVGIGAQLNPYKDQVKVSRVQSGSAAEAAGLRPGDLLLSVDGRSLENVSVTELTSLLRGPEDSTVVLSVRSGEDDVRDVTIVRQPIVLDEVDGLRLKSGALLNEGKLDESIALLEEAIARFPNSGRLYGFLGDSLRRAGRMEEANAAYRKAVEFEPDHPSAYYNLGYALLQLGHCNEAIAALKEAIRVDPRNLAAHNNISYCYELGGRYDLALPYRKEGVRLNPKDGGAHYRLGVAFAKIGLIHEAVREYKDAIEYDPENSIARTALGVTYEQLGRHQDAVAQLTQAIAINSENAAAHSALGDAYANLNKDVEAIAEYEKAIERNPNFMRAHFRRGKMLTKLGKFDQAVKSFQRCVELDPKSSTSFNELGWALNNLGRFRESLIALGNAIALHPNNSLAHFNLGTAYGNLGRFDEAAEAFREAVRINPKYTNAYLNLGKASEKNGKLEEALGAYQSALESSPKNRAAQAALARVQAQVAASVVNP